jgi:hypothetical protein
LVVVAGWLLEVAGWLLAVAGCWSRGAKKNTQISKDSTHVKISDLEKYFGRGSGLNLPFFVR